MLKIQVVNKARGSTLQELREADKKDKKKYKKVANKPFVNPNNKILLQTPESIKKNIRESNRTAILLRKEFDV